jgi:hypothetical protein
MRGLRISCSSICYGGVEYRSYRYRSGARYEARRGGHSAEVSAEEYGCVRQLWLKFRERRVLR